MTCNAIYRQKARTKSKDIGGSDRLTAVRVCQRVKLFRGFMHEEWTKWVEAPTHHITRTGRVKRPSISNVCEWVKSSRQRVKTETTVKSFKKCGISNALVGSEDDILYEESYASENNH
jgi:hypothetical protein